MPAAPQIGETVLVRQRRYLVGDVTPPPKAGDSHLVELACLDDDAQGQPLKVLWEKELDAEVLTGEAWSNLAKRGFDAPRLFSAYLHTLSWNRVTATDPKLFQAPFRAGIKIDAYQLEPLRKALLLPRVNLFIADDVGLGKTIEAGLIARELLLRKKVREIVVACPPSMLMQWREELESRFGLLFEILDKEYINKVRQERGYGINPWMTHTRFLVSHRLLIDEEYAGSMRDWLGDFHPGALLILDEAHHAAPSSGAKYAIDSKITRALREIAPRFEHRLFLSATPHNGHSNSFSALLEILDPQRFCRGVPVVGSSGKKLLDAVMVRRLKDDLREIAGGFPRRTVKQVDIKGLPDDAPELALSRLLDQYRQLREQRLSKETKRRQAAAMLLICGLQQRLLSSIEAFARTLKVHRKTVQKQFEQSTTVDEPPPNQFDLLSGGLGSDDERASLPEEEVRAEEEDQTEAASRASFVKPADKSDRAVFEKEQKLLEEMTDVAETHRARPDARVRHLVDWIRQNMCSKLPQTPGKISGGAPTWNETRLLIFTEFEDTRRYLSEQLTAAIEGTDRAEQRIDIYHGPTPLVKREEIKRAFNTDPKKHPLRILICTDAAREGLNLQCYCWNLFHFDVPWNPSRLEQRNGRIDRKLQPKDEVFCHYFVHEQRPEDRVLQVLVRKTETIKKELGSLAQVIEGRLVHTLRHGIRHAETKRLQQEIDGLTVDDANKQTIEDELEATRERQKDLQGQVDRLRSRLGDSKEWLGLNEAHFRDTLNCALELSGAKPMKSVDDRRFEFPAVENSGGASWAETMDALRAPRKRDQKLWEWRKESPIRPIVFEDAGTMDDDSVHLHLEHRIVQRLLGRFTAQGFVHHDLSRACLTQSADAIPRVILLGRLSLYGAQAARLHEELIAITARWQEPAQRRGVLTPYAREAEGKTLELLEEALLPKKSFNVNQTIQKKLIASAPTDIEELLPHLHKRGEGLAKDAEALLKVRGEQEAVAMRGILEDLKKRVIETARKTADDQQRLLWDDDEKRQYESNRRSWTKRLTQIEDELKTEPERIRDGYNVKARRIEPVGLVYLWPVSG